MALETGTYISDLVSSNPAGTDTLDKADDHLRLIKSTVKATFPNLTGAVTLTHTQLNDAARKTVANTFTLSQTISTTGQAQLALSGTATNHRGVSFQTGGVARFLVSTETTAESGSNAGSNFGIFGYDDTGAYLGNPLLINRATGTTTLTSLSVLGDIAGQGDLALGNASDQFAIGVSGTVTATQWGSPTTGGHLKIAYDRTVGSTTLTTGLLTAPVTAVTINGTGSVGIGTSSPAARLHSQIDTDGTALRLQRTGGTNIPILAFNLSESANVAIIEETGSVAGSIELKTATISRLQIGASGSILNISSGGLGFGTGSGGAVTQITSRTTGVTLNKSNGAITLFTAAGSATAATFTVTNSTVAATDTIILAQKSGTNLYNLLVTAVAAGSFNITFYTTGGTASDTPVFNFAVIKAVTA